jgi:thermostable 8-oxoguanine DNA glycosylase
METPKKISFGITESYSVNTTRRNITLNLEDYPELKDKSEEELKEFLKENYGGLKPTNPSEYLASLYDELMEQEIIVEKNTDETYELWFE